MKMVEQLVKLPWTEKYDFVATIFPDLQKGCAMLWENLLGVILTN